MLVQETVDGLELGAVVSFQNLSVVPLLGRDAVGEEYLFDRADTFRKLLPKIVRSYALDALDGSQQEQPLPTTQEMAAAFQKAIADAQAQTFPAVGMGEDVRLQSAQLAGGALVVGGRVVHLSVFATTSAAASDPLVSSLSRASVRRRNRE